MNSFRVLGIGRSFLNKRKGFYLNPEAITKLNDTEWNASSQKISKKIREIMY
jgi:hypothetical protein